MTTKNKFAQPCATCQAYVPKFAGTIVRVGGKWLTYCAEHSNPNSSPKDVPMQVQVPNASADEPWKVIDAEPTATQTIEHRTDAALNVAKYLLDLTSSPTLDETRVRELIAEYAQAPDTVYRERIIVVANGSQVELPDETRHETFGDLLTMVSCGLNVMLVGPAGSGKTHAAEQVFTALGLKFYFTGAIASEYKLSGFIDAQGRYVRTAFRDAFEHGHGFLFDEYDGSIPSATLFLQMALANSECAFPDGMVKRHPNFRVIAACNTFGMGADRVYVGRNQQDGAQLDRFVTLDWNYDEKLERALYGDTSWTARVQSVRKAVFSLKLRYVVSPRATAAGRKLIEAGMSQAKVEQCCIWKGMDSVDKGKIENALS